MFNNWYHDYLRMIHPRSSKNEIEYAYPDASMNDLLEGANFWFEIFKCKLLKLTFPVTNSPVSTEQTIESFIEFLGAVKTTLLTAEPTEDISNSAAQLIKSFEQLAKCKSEQVLVLLKDETESKLNKYILAWRKFVNYFVGEKDSTQILEYWNTETKEFVLYDAQEEYESFLQKTEDNPKILRVIDYWDYMTGLSYRDFLSRTIQLANDYYQIDEYKTEIETLDTQFKSVLVEDNGLMQESVTKYFPKSYFWWYYNSPKRFFLHGR